MKVFSSLPCSFSTTTLYSPSSEVFTYAQYLLGHTVDVVRVCVGMPYARMIVKENINTPSIIKIICSVLNAHFLSKILEVWKNEKCNPKPNFKRKKTYHKNFFCRSPNCLFRIPEHRSVNEKKKKI